MNLKEYEMEVLEIDAAHLNAICVPDPEAKIFYDIWSDALVWSDEQLESTTTEVIWGLRTLRYYRTHLMLDNAEPDNEVWDYCRLLFPNWVGFLPERRKPTLGLSAVYRRGEVSSRWCLRKLDRE